MSQKQPNPPPSGPRPPPPPGSRICLDNAALAAAARSLNEALARLSVAMAIALNKASAEINSAWGVQERKAK